MHYDSTDGGPEPYLIWSVQEEKSIDQKTFPDKNISIFVTELTVLISESKPTAYGNQVFSQSGRGGSNSLFATGTSGGCYVEKKHLCSGVC